MSRPMSSRGHGRGRGSIRPAAPTVCQCLDLPPTADPTPHCMTSDDLDTPETWWQQRMKANGDDPAMKDKSVYLDLVSRFCGPATMVSVFCSSDPRLGHRPDVRTEGEGVSETGHRFTRFMVTPSQLTVLHVSPPWTFLVGPPGTGKTFVLILKALDWIRKGEPVLVFSTSERSEGASRMIYHQLEQTLVDQAERSRLHFEHLDLRDGWDTEQDVPKAVASILQKAGQGILNIIADEAFTCNDATAFRNLCGELHRKAPQLKVWAAAIYHRYAPDMMTEVKLTEPLRSPPGVTELVQKTLAENPFHMVNVYTAGASPLPTVGPPVQELVHDGPGHKEKDPADCITCGERVARELKEVLGVGGAVGKCTRCGNICHKHGCCHRHYRLDTGLGTMSLFRKLAFCSKPSKKRGKSSGRDEECAVCQDVPTDPCTVPCGNNHVFCLACLQGLVSHNDHRRTFPCPLCRTRVKIPLRGLAVLKNDKDFRDRVMAKLPALKPRCRRQRSHSTSSSVSSTWLPNDVLEVVIPWEHLSDGAGGLDPSLLEAFEDVPLGRLYLDTLTRRNRALEDSLDSSDDFPLGAVDVQLQRRILEDIERERGAGPVPASPGSPPRLLPPLSDDEEWWSDDNDDALASAADHDIHGPKTEAGGGENLLVLSKSGDDPGTPRSEHSAHTPTLEHVAHTPTLEHVAHTPTLEHVAHTPTLEHVAHTPRGEVPDGGEMRAPTPIPGAASGDLDMSVVMQLIADMDRNISDSSDPRDTPRSSSSQTSSEDPVLIARPSGDRSRSDRNSGRSDEKGRVSSARRRQVRGEEGAESSSEPRRDSASEDEDWKHSRAAHWIPRPKFSPEELTSGARKQQAMRSGASPTDTSPRRAHQHVSPDGSSRDREAFDLVPLTRSPQNNIRRRQRAARPDNSAVFPSQEERYDHNTSFGGMTPAGGSEDSRSSGRRSQTPPGDGRNHTKRASRVRSVGGNHSARHASAEDRHRRRSESVRDASRSSGQSTTTTGDRDEYAENLRRVSSLLQPRSRVSRSDAANARELAAPTQSVEQDRKSAKNVTVITV